MKLKRITDKEIRFYHKEYGDEAHEHWFYTPDRIAQAQLEADQKVIDTLVRERDRARDSINEMALSIEGYTKMAEIFEDMGKLITQLINQEFIDIQYHTYLKNRFRALKQSTLKKYGGEK